MFLYEEHYHYKSEIDVNILRKPRIEYLIKLVYKQKLKRYKVFIKGLFFGAFVVEVERCCSLNC